MRNMMSGVFVAMAITAMAEEETLSTIVSGDSSMMLAGLALMGFLAHRKIYR